MVEMVIAGDTDDKSILRDASNSASFVSSCSRMDRALVLRWGIARSSSAPQKRWASGSKVS